MQLIQPALFCLSKHTCKHPLITYPVVLNKLLKQYSNIIIILMNQNAIEIFTSETGHNAWFQQCGQRVSEINYSIETCSGWGYVSALLISETKLIKSLWVGVKTASKFLNPRRSYLWIWISSDCRSYVRITNS